MLRKQFKNKSSKGFTLIELIIVIGIMAILALIYVPRIGNVNNTSKDSGVEKTARDVKGTLEYIVNKGAFTTTEATVKTELNGFDDAKNPFSLAEEGVSVDDAVSGAIIVDALPANTAASIGTDAATIADTNLATYKTKGRVYVLPYKDGYLVYGVNHNLAVVEAAIVK